MEVNIEQSWKQRLQGEFDKPYFKTLTDFVKEECRTNVVYPPGKFIFNAFDLCPFDNVKVVIIGQDPYHGPGQAHGLCFSVQDGVDFPPSLRNIFKEIQSDLGAPIPQTGNLTRWAKQGVLLLNATLTVRANMAGSHQKHLPTQLSTPWQRRRKTSFTYSGARTRSRKPQWLTETTILYWSQFTHRHCRHQEDFSAIIISAVPISIWQNTALVR